MRDIICAVAVALLLVGGLVIYGWYFYDPSDKPNCEEGWQVIRRFGFDIFLGDIPIEEARKQAGGNVLKWTKNIDGECNPYQ